MTMRSTLPIGDRFRGKPGRPRKVQPRAESGPNAGTAGSQTRIRSGAHASPLALQAVAPVHPRLLDLHSTALYLGVSGWTVRDLEAGRVLARVRVPLPKQGELRKILFDRVDLDRLIEAWKEEIQVGSEYGK